MKICNFLLATLLFIVVARGRAEGTAFNYQGRLNSGATPVNGTYDLSFSLFNVASGASQVGITVTNSAKPVSNGLFTVTLDFGNQFPGAENAELKARLEKLEQQKHRGAK